MKTIIFSSLWILLALSFVPLQAQDEEQEEQRLQWQLDSLRRTQIVIDENLSVAEQQLSQLFLTSGADYDMNIAYRELFTGAFSQYIQTHPATLHYPFNSMPYCHATSEDGKLRVYFWEDKRGGIFSNHHNLFQYEWNGKVNTVFMPIEFSEANSGYGVVLQVFTVTTSVGSFYLLAKIYQLSPQDRSLLLTMYYINNGVLRVVNAPFLVGYNSLEFLRIMYEESDVIFDYGAYAADNPKLFRYDDITKLLYVPVVNKRQKLTKRYEIFKLVVEGPEPYFEHFFTQERRGQKPHFPKN